MRSPPRCTAIHAITRVVARICNPITCVRYLNLCIHRIGGRRFQVVGSTSRRHVFLFPAVSATLHSTSGPDRLVNGYTRNRMHWICRSEGSVTYSQTHDHMHPPAATDGRATAEEKYSQYMSHNNSEKSPALLPRKHFRGE